ncbi:MAG: TolC family protein [Verrucomicrobiota bacterium]
MFSEFKNFKRLALLRFPLLVFLIFNLSILRAEEFSEASQQKRSEISQNDLDSGPFVLSVENINQRIRSANPRVLFEKESVQRALEQSFQERAALLPQISFDADQNRSQFARGFAGDSFNTPPFNTFTANVVGTMKIFDTESYANFKISQLGTLIAEQDYEVALQDILTQTIQTYFTHLRDLRAFDIALEDVKREQELLDLAKNQFEAGSAVKIDVTRAEVRLATERRNLMEAETSVVDSLLQLKSLLDLDFDSKVKVDRSVIDGGLKSPPSIKLYSQQKPLTELRPELISQEKQLEQAKLARKAADWQRLPSVSLYGQWGYESDTIFDGNEEEGWIVGIQASVPIFEGFRISAERREADAAVRQNLHLMQELRNDIEREFRFSMIEMDSRYEQIAIAREEIRLGRDEVKQAQERYREGLADNRELIDAQERLSEAESSEMNAIYLYGLSRLAFARSIGAPERVLD